MDCCKINEEHRHCSCCDRVIYDKIDLKDIFCSIDCACMSGRFSVREGWINSDQEIKKCEPKMPWWLPENQHVEYVKKITGKTVT